MKPRLVFSLAPYARVLGTVALGHETGLALIPSRQEPPLKLTESTDVIIIDLESYIPDYMEERSIPGVAIALVRDGMAAGWQMR